MRRPNRADARPIPPLDAAALERLALRYVERFATTQGKLVDYLKRKIRERGWDGEPADTAALAAKMADLGYVDDRAWAEAMASALGRRGLGAGRVRQALSAARVGEADASAVAPAVANDAVESALRLAKRKRIGPFALAQADRSLRQKQLATMIRAGHGFALSRIIVDSAPGECDNLDSFTDLMHCSEDE